MWEYLGSGMWHRVAQPVKEWTQEEVKAWHQALIKELDEEVSKMMKR
jgi:hypothetical protein